MQFRTLARGMVLPTVDLLELTKILPSGLPPHTGMTRGLVSWVTINPFKVTTRLTITLEYFMQFLNCGK